MQHPVRRKDREISTEEAKAILKKGLYGTLATVSEDNSPYAVPLFYVYIDGAVYFHCAAEGHKLENIRHNNRVCFNVAADVELIPSEFAAYYSSATVFGRAETAGEEDKRKALTALIEKYSPEFYKDGMEYIDRLYQVTVICKIIPDIITGKARRKQ